MKDDPLRGAHLGISTLTGVVMALAAVVVLPSSGLAYTGSLTSTNFGILGTGNWIDPGPSELWWEVTQNPDNSWHYAYTFSHPKGATSHFILEVSEDFTKNDIFDASGDFGDIEIGTFTEGPGNPSLPEPVYGIKFDNVWGTTSSFAFNSWRMPAWGDFYSKNGRTARIFDTAWNAGFTAGDWDPTAPPADGALENHLLVPNTAITPIPEPGTLLLLGTGLVGVALARRRHRR